MLRKFFGLTALLLAVMLITTGCWLTKRAEEPAPEQQSAPIAAPAIDLTGAIAYEADLTDSTLQWFGKMKLITKAHNGTVGLTSGQLWAREGKLIAGEFVIDMTNINDRDLTSDDSRIKLVTHLKSDDFFSVSVYPEAKLKITKVEQLDLEKVDEYNITADLTIKDKTNQIVFPATVIIDQAGELTAKAEFSIDRTLWEVRWGSEKFFADLGDKVLEDQIDFIVNLSAAPKETTAAETPVTGENETAPTDDDESGVSTEATPAL